MLGISYILAFNHAPIILVGTAAIIVINYVIRELPVGIEGGIASLRQIDPSIEEAATDLGADQATVFKSIVLPLVRPAFLSSLSYTFVRSMTAVSAVIFLIHGVDLQLLGKSALRTCERVIDGVNHNRVWSVRDNAPASA